MPPRKLRRETREPKLHKLADKLTEILIYFMVIFSLWAFGTTEPWSIWTMNITAYTLGILLVTKWIIRLATKYTPNPELEKNELSPKQNRLRLTQKTCTILVAGSMFLLLAYILTSAINARASFNFDTNEYTYFEGVNKNLPHSYDARGTWFLFWQYLGLIILHFSIKDWLYSGIGTSRGNNNFNPKLKRLLFLIFINGGILAFEGILQKVFYGESRGKLLFLVTPSINIQNDAFFGPFAYRSNAASYLNLIWPISLGFFIHLGLKGIGFKNQRIGRNEEFLLIPCIILCASCPIITLSRGGALVMIGLLVISIIAIGFRRSKLKYIKLSLLILLLIGFSVAFMLGWEKLITRMDDLSHGFKGRIEIFKTVLKMVDEYPIYGSGPGSFEAIAQFELSKSFQNWESWAHNDYLEFYITFGIPGGLIISIMIITIIAKSFAVLFYGKNKELHFFNILSLTGLAIHATMDFPLQVYSVLILLIIILASLELGKSTSSIE